MQGIVLLIVAIVVITAIVGAIAQFLNKLNEANAPAPRAARGDAPRQTQKDMDRFLAEIDRLRKKNSDQSEPTAAKPKQSEPPPRPKPRPNQNRPSRTDRVKPAKPVAEVVEPPKRKRIDAAPMEAPPIPVMPGTLSPGKLDPKLLPVAAVVGAIPAAGASTGAPSATRVSKLPVLPGSKPTSKLDTNLATLLASGNGIVMGVILQEVLGPPKCRKK